MDTPSVEVNNHGALKFTPSMLIATLSPTSITRIITNNIATSSSTIEKTINPIACAGKVANGICKKPLDESISFKDGQVPNLEISNNNQNKKRN